MKKILFFLLLTLQLGVFAQVDTLRGPHGGRIHSYMDYRIEMVGCNDYLEIYLYNKVMDPLNNYGVLGDVKFYYPNEVYSSSPLVPYGADGFTAKIPSPIYYNSRVTMNFAGQALTAKFDNVCSATVGGK